MLQDNVLILALQISESVVMLTVEFIGPFEDFSLFGVNYDLRLILWRFYLRLACNAAVLFGRATSWLVSTRELAVPGL